MKRNGSSLAARISASLVVTTFILCALEGFARLAGPDAGVEDPYMGFRGIRPLFVPEEGVEDTLGTAPNRIRWFNPERFSRLPDESTLRIFCLGGSTVYGHPYDGKVAFPRALEVVLDDAEATRRHEVINCGGISYASYRLTHIAREIADYEPDVVVILTGHNEFLERRTYGTFVEADLWVQTVQRVFSSSRFYGWMRSALLGAGAPGSAGKGRLGADVVAILDHAAGLDLYHRDDVFFENALEHFRHNLEAIVASSRAAGALPILVTPASNQRDFSPFKSETTDSPLANTEHTTSALQIAASGYGAGDAAAVLAMLDRALVGDGRHAGLHFLRGQALARAGEKADADLAFARALEEDVTPLRARSEFVRAVRTVATQADVPLVDPVRFLADTSLARTGHRAPGGELFLDHVHPTPVVHGWIAEGIAQRLLEAGLIQPDRSDWKPASSRPARQVEILDAIDPISRARSDLNLAKTLSWAGKQREARPFALSAAEVLVDDADAQYTAGVAYLMSGENDAASSALGRALALAPNHARARSNLGSLFHGRGETGAAIAAFRRAAADDTMYVTPLISLATVLDQEGRTREAIDHLREAVRRDPNHSGANAFLGEFFLKMRAHEPALVYLDTAILLDPTAPSSHVNRGLALLALGDAGAARLSMERGLALAVADDASIRVNLAMACMATGDSQAARQHLETALALRPGDPMALRLRDELEP